MLLTTDDVILKDFIEAVRVLDKVYREARVNDDVSVVAAREAARKRVAVLLNELDYLTSAVPVAHASGIFTDDLGRSYVIGRNSGSEFYAVVRSKKGNRTLAQLTVTAVGLSDAFEKFKSLMLSRVCYRAGKEAANEK